MSGDRKAYEARYGKGLDENDTSYKHSEAYQMAFDLSIDLRKTTKKLPKSEKFVLSAEILQTVDDVVGMIRKYEKSKAKNCLYSADYSNEKLMRLIRTAYELKYSAMNVRKYEYYSERITELGACIGGLIKIEQDKS